jgi:Fe-S cluster biogenesis protein NfuA/nitrite reductase/ring-hydroxylating ferredoxin subunit
MQLTDTEVRDRVAAVDVALSRIETIVDPAARAAAEEAIGGLLDLYGEAFLRISERVAADAGPAVLARLADDELVRHLLLLHGAHPEPVEVRIQRALDSVRPYLGSHGGDVELLGVERGVARLRLDGTCHGCPSSTVTLKLAIEKAIAEAAPDLEGLETEGVVEETAPPRPAVPAETPVEAPAFAFVPLEALGARPAGVPGPAGARDGRGEATWRSVDVEGLDETSAAARDVAGQPLLFLALGPDVYAYRGDCPACGSSLDGAAIDEGELRCPGCGHRFDARHAGRSLEIAGLHLDPVPLLVDGDGSVRVALAGVGA